MAKDFKIAKCEGVCSKCEQELLPETPIVAMVRDGEEELVPRGLPHGVFRADDRQRRRPDTTIAT